MPSYKPYTEIASLPANSQGDRTILEAHLDENNAALADVLERLAQSLFSSGGVVMAGTVTNPSDAEVRVQGRMGVTSDGKTLVAVGDQITDLAGVATSTKCLVVIQAAAGSLSAHNFTDATTGEALTHNLISQWGLLTYIEGDASNYPALPDDCVPVAEVTKTGASTLTIDATITATPTLRYSGSGGDWGTLGGTLSDQTDLQNALDAKLGKLAAITTYSTSDDLDAIDDLGAYVRVTAAATINLPDGFPAGWQCVIVNATSGDTVALTADTTLTLPGGFDAEIQNRRAVTVIHVGSDVWEVHGALEES